MFSSLVHLMPSLSISYPYLIEFHDFADNIQQGMKHQIGGAIQAEPVQTKMWEPVRFSNWMPCENVDGFHWEWELRSGYHMSFSLVLHRFSANRWEPPNIGFNHWFQSSDYFRIRELSVLMKPCKTLFINTPSIWKMYKWIRKRKKENLQDVKLVQTRCEETYWLICIDTQIPQLLKGGTDQWGVDWFDLFLFFTNHHNIRIVVPIISKTLTNQQSGNQPRN